MNLEDFIRDVADFPKPGIIFKDITPLLSAPQAFSASIDQLAAPFRDKAVEVVMAAEARGFIFGAGVALELGAAFVPVRKPGKLPWETRSKTYALEYGEDTLCVHADAVQPGQKVLLVDDVLATGGTMRACADLVKELRGSVVGCAFLIELDFLHGRDKLRGYRLHSLIHCEGE